MSLLDACLAAKSIARQFSELHKLLETAELRKRDVRNHDETTKTQIDRSQLNKNNEFAAWETEKRALESENRNLRMKLQETAQKASSTKPNNESETWIRDRDQFIRENENLKNDIKNLKEMFETKLKACQIDTERAGNARNVNLIETISTHSLTVDNLKKNLNEFQQTIIKQKNDIIALQTELHDNAKNQLLPVQLGKIGENDAKQYLISVFHTLADVIDVSKTPYGMDIRLMSHKKGWFDIRIDTKNLSTTFVPNNEIEKFKYQAINMNPPATAYILFSRHRIKFHDNGHCQEEIKIGNKMRTLYQVGNWDYGILAQKILEVMMRNTEHAKPIESFAGSKKINDAFLLFSNYISLFVQFINRISEAKNSGGHILQDALQLLTEAHSVNPESVTQSTICAIKGLIPANLHRTIRHAKKPVIVRAGKKDKYKTDFKITTANGRVNFEIEPPRKKAKLQNEEDVEDEDEDDEEEETEIEGKNEI